MRKIHVVAISDTHCQLDAVSVPDGDILVHAGDATYRGDVAELSEFNFHLGKLPHRHKIFISGNHDWLWQKNRALAASIVTNGTYLQDSGVEVLGVKIYGSPHQPEFGNWAFNLPRYDGSLEERWSHIPGGLDILITHGPPQNIGDLTVGYNGMPKENVGCYDLMERIKVVKPKYHVFGHIHSAYGVYKNQLGVEDTTFVNASVCNENYNPVNAPTEFDIEVI